MAHNSYITDNLIIILNIMVFEMGLLNQKQKNF